MGLFGAVLGSGRGAKGRPDYPVDATGHSGLAAPSADGNFLGNVHQGVGANPEAFADSSPTSEGGAPAAAADDNDAGPKHVVPINLPLIPEFDGYSVTIEISGVPEISALSSGRSLGAGRWALDPSQATGVELLDANGPLSLDVSYTVTDIGTGESSHTDTVVKVVPGGPVQLGPVSAVTDSDVAPDSIAENASDGDSVGITAAAADPDYYDVVTFNLLDDAGGRFAIDPETGEITVADGSLLDYETATEHAITVQAVSTDGSTTTESFTISLIDDTSEFSVSAISDADATANRVSESASNGDVVGLTAFASDGDGSDTITYSLVNDAGGRFAVDPATGVVTVADASLLDYETATRHTIRVLATSSDGSTKGKNFSIRLADDKTEFSISDVSDADSSSDAISESAAKGDVVGITAFADDADGSDKVRYSLSDNPGGLFKINSKTGVVTINKPERLDFESVQNHTITVQAKSSDGSISTKDFTISVTDDTSEFAVTAISDTDAGAETISESIADGATVGVTAFASDADGTDTVSYSLADDAGGRFAIDPATGVVTVADASLLDYEAATSHTITVLATSTDGSTETKDFTISLTDDTSEFTVSAVSDADAAADSVSESASNGDVVGVTAFAGDGDATDSVSYSLANDAGGRFAIDPATGVVTVADASLLDYETATSHTITVLATSTDGSTRTQSFTVGIADNTSEFTVSAISDTDASADTAGESASNGDVVGVTAFASDADGSDSVSYSLADDAGGRFAIDNSTGVVTVADASLLDFETATSHTITVLATSTDGSTQTQTFTIGISDDTSEFTVSAISDTDASANTVGESASDGDVVGVTAFADDGDATDSVSYSLTDNAGGRFAIDASTGVVTVADASLLDFETAASHTITVQATSTDGSTQTQSFTVGIVDDTSEFTVSAVTDSDAAANTVGESASNGDVVGITAFASDADGSDTVSYNLTDDAGGRFAIDSSTGVVTVADASLLDYETATSHTITVQATSTDGSIQTQSFTVGIADDASEFTVSAVSDSDAAGNAVSESASNGDVVGVSAFASDADGSDTVSYSLTDDAGGRFAIDASTGVVTVADASLLDYETATSHTISVQATSTDGSTQTQSFTIGVSDDTSEFTVSAVSDIDAASDTVSESASNGDVVGVTAFASDADATDTVSYSLTDDAGGRFIIDSTTGVVTVADASLLDYETATSHTVTVQATSTDGSTQTQSFTIALSDDTSEFSVSAISDADSTANGIAENASTGDVVGITALATDADGSDSVTYSLTDDAGGRFAIDSSTGEVTVADGSLLDYETATSHTITVQATSNDGSIGTENFTIPVSNVNEAPTAASVDGPAPATGAILHLDATDIDADGNAGDNPADGTSVSRWEDSSANNLDAIQKSGAPVVASGAINGNDAIDFAGANDALQVPDHSDINLSTYSKRSFAIAFQTGDDVAGFQVIFEEGGTVRGYNLAIAGDPANGGRPTLWAFVWNNAEWAGGDQYKAINLGTVDTNETYNVVMVHDASAADFADRTFSAYVNGDFVGAVANVDVQRAHGGDIGVGGYLNDTVNPVTHAGAGGDGGEFSGMVGEVLIWNDALDSQQISETSSYLNDKWAGSPSVSESAPDGTAVFSVSDVVDQDAGETYTYALADDAGGRFAIDASTGVVTVADASLLDQGTAESHDVSVRVTDSGGNTLDVPVTIEVGVGNAGPVGAISDTDATSDSVAESVWNGDVVGITAFASDGDTGDSVTYSLTDDAGGRFAIDANTGVVTVADASLLDYESATSHSITVQAASTDGSTESKTFSISVSDDTSEFTVSAISDADAAADTVSEGASNGDVVGVTAFANDADSTDTVSYGLTDDAGGRFTIDADTGVVTVADATLLDYETATSHTITVQATSTDGSMQTQSFTIGLSDDTSEFSVSALSDTDASANTVSEDASNGDIVGVTASASDADATDSVTYSLTDDAGGRFAIDANTGVVTVADASKLDYESATSHTVTVQATSSDGSTSSESFTINLSDANDAPRDLTLTPNAGISLNANGGNNAYLYNAAGGDILGGLSAMTIEVQFSSPTLGSGGSPLFSYHAGGGSDEIELAVYDRGATAELYIEIGENATGIPAYDANALFDGNEHQVSLTWDNATGSWEIYVDGSSIATGSGLATGQTIASGGTIVLGQEQDSNGGGFDTTQVFSGSLSDVRIFDDVRSATEIGDNAFNQVEVGEPGLVADWRIDDFSGGVVVDQVSGNDLTVGNVTGPGWTGNTPSLVTGVPEGAANGHLVGTVAATDPDASDTLTYSLDDNAGGRFLIDPATGAVTVADASLLDYEAATSHDITVRVTDSGGANYTETFTIDLIDNAAEFSASAISDSDASTDTVSESASNGDVVGVTSYASDADATDTVTYSLMDDAGGRFAVDANTGVVTVADASLLDYETATSHTITVQATSTDGSTSTQNFTIALSDDTGEFTISAVFNSNAAANTVSESASNGDVVGITALATDADATDTVTYSLTDDAGGRFAIDANTGAVTVADASLLDYESATSHAITIQASSSDGSTQSQTFTIGVADAVEAGTVSASDSAGNEDSAIALDITLSDLEPGATHTVTITGVPTGASLSAGTDQGGGTWTLTTAQVSGLSITPPADSNADFQLNVSVTSDDGSGPVTSSTETLDVTVDAVADAPALTLTDGYAETLTFESAFETGGGSSGFVSGSLDGWSAIPGNEIEIWHENEVAGDAYEGDEFIELNYEGSGTYADAGGIERTISTENGTPYELSFQVSPRPGFESYMDFEVSAIDVSSGDVLKTETITWDGNSVSALTWSEYTLQFVGTGGDVQLVFEDIGAVHDYGRGAYVDDIRLSEFEAYTAAETVDMSELISTGLTDTDGSETLGDIEISNIPTGAVVAVGGTPVDTTDGAITVTTAQLPSLTLQPPAGFTGDLYLDVTVTSTEAANGDTASSTDTLTIAVVSNDENMDGLGNSASNNLSGNSGDNTLYGGGGNDSLSGNAGEDILYGGSSNDRLYGGDDNDALMGGDGGDRLYGNDGDDFLYGGDGGDRLYGGDGDDTLYGGDGNDRLDGGAGDDLLIGGGGDDIASGGDGNDTYVFGAGWGDDSFDGGGGSWTDTIQIEGKDGLTAYNGWTVSGATVVDSGDGYLDLADDSDGTITLDDGSELTFTDVDRIEW